jgi:putative ABC transport system permease protein
VLRALFDVDAWVEIGESLSRHPLRTGLTMGSVAWGTFVLLVLLGVGQGLQNSVRWQFRDDATNSLWVYKGETGRPFEGNPVGRAIRLNSRDLAAVGREIEEVEHLTGRFYGPRSPILRYGDRAAAFSMRSVHPDHQHLERTEVTQGRFLDDLDLAEKRKVVVLGRKVSEFLFRGADPRGEYVSIAGVPFLVIGVFEDIGSEGEMEQIYVPITTAQATWGRGDELDQIMFTITTPTLADADRIEGEVRQMLAARHHFDPRDRDAVRVRNNLERYERVQRIFELLETFVTWVGVGTVTAGLVGVSNITLVSVRERTGEIALRKALGATPGAIVARVVQEATVLTALSGYLGIVAGVAVLVALRTWLPENEYLALGLEGSAGLLAGARHPGALGSVLAASSAHRRPARLAQARCTPRPPVGHSAARGSRVRQPPGASSPAGRAGGVPARSTDRLVRPAVVGRVAGQGRDAGRGVRASPGAVAPARTHRPR